MSDPLIDALFSELKILKESLKRLEKEQKKLRQIVAPVQSKSAITVLSKYGWPRG
jgi:hypothetical protein